jgi:Flp pilus assembly protein TadD
MSSPRSIERLPAGGGVRPASAGSDPFALRWVVGAALLAVLSACADLSAPPDTQSNGPAKSAITPPSGSGGSAANGANGTPAPGTPGAGSPAVPIPPRAAADFNRAVGMMRSGNTTEAELEFKQISINYPQLSAPYVNLGILFRNSGRLDQSEDALKAAVERNGASAVAWTELGATQRLRGEFQDAAASYEKAIAADPNYAAAYRNLGVVSDLYLADPERALTAFERYKEITREDKPVSGWIAELRQRTGKPPVRPAAAPQPADQKAPEATPPERAKPPDGAAPAPPGASDSPQGAAPASPQGRPPRNPRG